MNCVIPADDEGICSITFYVSTKCIEQNTLNEKEMETPSLFRMLTYTNYLITTLRLVPLGAVTTTVYAPELQESV